MSPSYQQLGHLVTQTFNPTPHTRPKLDEFYELLDFSPIILIVMSKEEAIETSTLNEKKDFLKGGQK